jgi:hypothetical protein
VDVTDDHSLLSVDGRKLSPNEVVVGATELMHSDIEPNAATVPESHYASYRRLVMDKRKYRVFDTMVEAAKFCNSLRHFDTVDFSLDFFGNRFCVLLDKCERNPHEKNRVVRMEDITDAYRGSGGDAWVYDLTTSNHHFAAGVGNLVVHNTDSVFFTFNLEDPLTGDKIRGKRALEITITLAQEAARLCSLYLPPPMKLAYEKTLMNFVLISKKRYVGMLYETNPDEGHLKYMGLALKRRDVCDYLKDVYGGLIMIFKEGAVDTIKRAIEFLNQALAKLVDGGVTMDKLVFSKALRSYYKKPEQIAHAVLAERVTLRDPGNRPKPGDRMQFAVVEVGAREQRQILEAKNRRLAAGEKPKKSLLMGDRIETPAFIANKGLKLDYAYYVENQLLNPIRQLFGLILEPILEHKGRSVEIPAMRRDLEEIRKGAVDLEDFMAKREKYCSERVENLLFGEVLITIENRKNGLRPITEYFSSAAGTQYLV